MLATLPAEPRWAYSRQHHVSLYAVPVADTRALYERVADAIAASIASGDYRVGGKLPAHDKLADEHGVSRGTAEKAVRLLARRGVLEVRHGLGTFVIAAGQTREPLTVEQRLAAVEEWQKRHEAEHGA